MRANSFDAQFTWIEPNYGHVATDFADGSSQHPLDSIPAGELLLKQTYEAIRRSPLWNSSLLIVTWDEHGGFYDHVGPPPAVAPGDAPYRPSLNRHGFDFRQYGPRVPTLVISPYTPRSVIDHRIYDHASIPATLERLFKLKPFNERITRANNVLSLASLSDPRDTPAELPPPPEPNAEAATLLDALEVELRHASRPDEPLGQARDGLEAFVWLATRAHLQISPITQYLAILRRSASLRTRQDARNYLEEVRRLLVANPNLRGG